MNRPLLAVIFTLAAASANSAGGVNYSLCVRFNFRNLGPDLFTISDTSTNLTFFAYSTKPPAVWLSIWIYRNRETHYVYLPKDPNNVNYGASKLLLPNKWSHMCVAYGAKNRTISAAIDGKAMISNHVVTDKSGDVVTLEMLRNADIISCRASSQWKETGVCALEKGGVADLNIWSKELDSSSLIEFTSCRNYAPGDLVHWVKSEQQWNYQIRAICKPFEPFNFPLPDEFTQATSYLMCKKYSATMTVIKNLEMQRDLFSHLQRLFGNKTKYELWTGWTDERNEGIFSDINTNVPIDEALYAPYSPGEPNGGTLENCVFAYSTSINWFDAPCSAKMWSFCHVGWNPVFKARGLPSDSIFEYGYSSISSNMADGNFLLSGYYDSEIYFDEPTESWRIGLTTDPELYAVANISTRSPPLGNIRFMPSSELGGPDLIVNINPCDDDTNFNCQDGSCIPIEKRCDSSVDCQDGSDEFVCDLIQVPHTYLPYVPAPPPRSSAPGQRSNVSLGVDVQAVLYISEVRGTIDIQFELSLTWKDPRVTFLNLKEELYMNTVGREDGKKIWQPIVIFLNTKNRLETTHDEKSDMTIRRTGGYEVSPNSELHINHMYRGEDNNITISRVYSVQFMCDFDMRYYPFDMQKCNMEFILQGTSGQFIDLIKDKLRYSGSIDLLQYYVYDYKMLDGIYTRRGEMEVEVQILLGRRLLNQAITSFLPALLICIVSFSTSYYDKHHFTPVVSVNLTSLLCLTTLFISVANSLPRTAYLKTIDLWFIVNMCVPFFEVLLLTVSMKLQAFETEQVKKSTDMYTGASAVPRFAFESKEKKLQTPSPALISSLPLSSSRLWTKLARFGLPVVYVTFCLVTILPGLANNMNAPKIVTEE